MAVHSAELRQNTYRNKVCEVRVHTEKYANGPKALKKVRKVIVERWALHTHNKCHIFAVAEVL